MMRVSLPDGEHRFRVFCDNGAEVGKLRAANIRLHFDEIPLVDLEVVLDEADVTCELGKLCGIFNGKRYRMVEV